jgi:hypothetical protein
MTGELEELTRVLAEVGDAIAAADLPRLLDCEERLARAASRLASLPLNPAGDRVAQRGAIVRARTALARCRMLGSALQQTTQDCLALQGRGGEYGREGARSGADVRQSFDARI